MTMTAEQSERRLWPRVPQPDKFECWLQLRSRVRLVDISLTGALLASDVSLPVGTEAQLRSTVSSTAFAPGVQVRRSADGVGRRSSAGLGAAFTAMDERSRRSLEEFLRKASL
jgi:hypothetical protein